METAGKKGTEFEKGRTRALLFCQGYREELAPLLKTRPSPLLNVADKPIIFHILEHLAQRGIDTFDLVLHHFPEQIEEKIEGGTRWGVKVNYHLAKDPNLPLNTILPAAKTWKNCLVLIGFGDSLPLIPDHPFEMTLPQFYRTPDKKWTGWALIHSDDLKGIPGNTPYSSIPFTFKLSSAKEVKSFINTEDVRSLKETNQKFLTQGSSSLLYPTALKNIEPGVWISRAVIIEPGVKITPPVMIGESTQIKSGAKIGPNAIIENQCIVDNESNIKDSLICQKSYVGEGLEIDNCIVDRNSLINLNHGTHLSIKEEHIISEAFPPPFTSLLGTILDGSQALILFVLLSPLYLIMRAFFPIKKEKMAARPLKGETIMTFDLYSFELSPLFRKKRWMKQLAKLPFLWNIIRGEISFVGTKIRTKEEIEDLPKEWKELILATKAGLVTLADLVDQESFNVDELYAQDAYYVARQSFLFDAYLIFRWFLKKIIG